MLEQQQQQQQLERLLFQPLAVQLLLVLSTAEPFVNHQSYLSLDWTILEISRIE